MIHLHRFVFSPIQVNSYLLFNDANDCFIIDPGCYFPQEAQQLQQFIAAKGLNPVGCILTHTHLDHVFGTQFVCDTWQLQPQFHPLDEPLWNLAEASGERWGLPFQRYNGPVIHLPAAGFLTLGNEQLEIRHVPGHAPGHLVFYHAPQQILIAGDTLFQGSIGRTDLPGGDHTTLLTAIRNQIFSLPNETVVYPGHGAPTTVGEEKRNNPFF